MKIIKEQEKNQIGNYTNVTDSMIYKYMIDGIGQFINLGIVFGPPISYMAQILKFRRLKSNKGFSLSMTNKLLFANMIRIFFWIGLRFNKYLLYQSILIVIFQFIIIYSYLKYNDPSSLQKKILRNPFKSNIENYLDYFKREYLSWDRFWEWNSIGPFAIYFLTIVLILLIISLYIGFDNLVYMNILGTIATFIEAILCVPQIVKNYQLKYTETLSLIAFVFWAIGDSFRLGYYIVTKVPVQFVCCGLTQTATDIVIIIQIFYYHKEGILDVFVKEFTKKEDLDKMNRRNENDNNNNNEEERLLCEQDNQKE